MYMVFGRKAQGSRVFGAKKIPPRSVTKKYGERGGKVSELTARAMRQNDTMTVAFSVFDSSAGFLRVI
jgi:hypothetical protein